MSRPPRPPCNAAFVEQSSKDDTRGQRDQMELQTISGYEAIRSPVQQSCALPRQAATPGALCIRAPHNRAIGTHLWYPHSISPHPGHT
jgi:hypothetical protein